MKIKNLLRKSLLLSGLISTVVLMGGCGKNTSGSDTKFTYWLYTVGDSSYYDTYNDNPALKYALSKTYGPDKKKLDFDFWVPANGTASDNFSTMIGSGDYADVIENTIGDTAKNYYKDGVSLDLTDYVKKDMPNYLAFLDKYPDLKKYAVTKIDGKDHYLGICSFTDAYAEHDWGTCYRRDWIVKYGTNPVTGAAFTGGYSEQGNPDSWTDDVVFPSGGTDPVYISDWEWMFGIFEKAYTDLGIEDGYCYSLPYNGFLGAGELSASFGGGASGYWFRDLDNKVQYGPESEQFKTYLECMNHWYKEGWLDKKFDERTADMFYAIDSTSVYQGKIGMWYGLKSQLGGRMDSGDKLTTGIYVAGASTPINDLYGSDEVKNKEPYCGFGGTQAETTYLVTTAAKDKDLDTLCSYFDYFYSNEGALLRSVGLSADQTSKVDSAFLKKYGLEKGCYTKDADGKYVLDQTLVKGGGDLAGAVTCNKMPGIKLVKDVDRGYADSYTHSLDQWGMYQNKGLVMGAKFIEDMSEDDKDTYTNVSTKITDYLNVNAVKFIKGSSDVSSEQDWNNWSTVLKKYGADKVTDILQKYADQSPISSDSKSE